MDAQEKQDRGRIPRSIRSKGVLVLMEATGSEPILGNIQPDSPLRRLVNWFIDLNIMLFIYICIPGRMDHFTWLLFYIIYYFGFESITQRTPAKYITKTKVVSVDNTMPTIRQIIGRTLSRFVPIEPLSGLLNTYRDDVWWHDKWSGTLVVKVERNVVDSLNPR